MFAEYSPIVAIVRLVNVALTLYMWIIGPSSPG